MRRVTRIICLGDFLPGQARVSPDMPSVKLLVVKAAAPALTWRCIQTAFFDVAGMFPIVTGDADVGCVNTEPAGAAFSDAGVNVESEPIAAELSGQISTKSSADGVLPSI